MLKKLTGKKRILAVTGAVLIGMFIIGFAGALALRVNAAEAQEIALAAAGGGEIVSQEIEREGLWSEYSFDILSGDTWYEVEVNAFGSVVSLESSLGYSHWD